MHVKPLPAGTDPAELVPNEAIGTLSLQALGLLVYLLRFGETHDGPIGNLATRKRLGISKNRVEQCAVELRHAGYLWTDRLRGPGGGFNPVTYVSAVPDPERAAEERRLHAEMSAKLSERASAKVVW